MGKKWLYFLFSGLIIIPGLISLCLWGVRPSIDFTGGTLYEFRLPISTTDKQNQPLKIEKEDVKKIVESQKIEVASIQDSGDKTFLLRMKPIDKDQHEKLQKDLQDKFGAIKELRFETVGPAVGQETTMNAVKAVIVASVAIIIYVALAFRKIPKPYSSWKFGVCAVVSLVHDVLVVLGLFSILGHFAKVEIDSLFITGLLTIMGFTVHDTIVVFDRIRENLNKMPGADFTRVVNESVLQTLARSLSTSLTVLLTLLALLLFGGETIKWFVVALLIGIASGTYSSIFNAAPLLVIWNDKTRKKSSQRS